MSLPTNAFKFHSYPDFISTHLLYCNQQGNRTQTSPRVLLILVVGCLVRFDVCAVLCSPSRILQTERLNVMLFVSILAAIVFAPLLVIFDLAKQFK